MLMAGRSTEETRQMLFGGVEIVVREGTGEGEGVVPSSASARSSDPALAETWKRVPVAPGIELHLCDDPSKPRAGEGRCSSSSCA